MATRTKSQKRIDDLSILRSDTLAGIPWLLHGFSTRCGGVSEAYGGQALNLGITPQDSRAAVERNRDLFLQAIGASDDGASVARASSPGTRVEDPRHTLWPMIRMRQVHSSVIHRVDELPAQPLQGDGLVTNRPGIVLAVRVADCLPVLMADPVRRAVGAFHAGWRGTLARVVEKGVGEFRRQFGSDPADMKAAIGPGIHRCCYEVSEELRDKFESQFEYVRDLFEEVFSSDPVRRKYPLLFMNMRAPGHGEPPRTPHLDLVEANRRQLLAAGVRQENIWTSDLCTSCRTDLLFSHRREKGVTGRMVGAIAIKKSE
ncbi:MAG: peptidoglycan editing factor PgeF [Acidobacteriia bacterium]|nr:peptidoglycan editing factor PgeF [Terriglobia bacterium]